MRVAPGNGLDDAADFDRLLPVEDARLTVVRVSDSHERVETQGQTQKPQEMLSHSVNLLPGLSTIHAETVNHCSYTDAVTPSRWRSTTRSRLHATRNGLWYVLGWHYYLYRTKVVRLRSYVRRVVLKI
jgi:hypothetical protein